jgi:hypothetical protein
MVKNESMRLVTFTTEESTEESKNGWRNNGGREEARTPVSFKMC